MEEQIPIRDPELQPSPVAMEPVAPTDSMSELEVLVRARYPLVFVVTWEESRVMAEVNTIARRLNKRVFEWSVNAGFVPGGTSIQSQKHRDAATQDPLVAMDKVIEYVDPALFVFKDLHAFLGQQNVTVVRRLREIAATMKNSFKTIIVVCPNLVIPPDLEKDVTVLDYPLPCRADFEKLLDEIVEEVKENPKLSVALDGDIREQILHALLGLTLMEGENVLAKALVTDRGLCAGSVAVVLSEKKQIIRKNGLLEYYETDEGIEDVGGLNELKHWLVKRSVSFSDRARAFGLPSPKGVLLLGVQGCGKSLMAKVVSRLWQMPLLRFDVGRLFGSLVGSSESNMRRAIQVAESISPAVLWIDEIDKAFRGSKESGGSTDAGTSARVFSTFLTWLSEKTAPVFVVATANDISNLPPELLRKGRFDEIFFVDLPVMSERRAIFAVQLRKRNRDPDPFDLNVLAAASEGYSGAEIEECVVSALFDAFYEGKELGTEEMLSTLEQSVPLSKTMEENIVRLRAWADGRARRAAGPLSKEAIEAMERESAEEQAPGRRTLEL